jgi:hypothetical protein
MKLLSIDVGIKNLAYCLFNVDGTIAAWNVINLCGELPVCSMLRLYQHQHQQPHKLIVLRMPKNRLFFFRRTTSH